MHHPKLTFSLFLLFIGCIVTTFTFNSCQHDPIVTVKPPIDTLVPLEPCDSSKVYFQNDIMPYINSTCAIPGCHNNESPAAGINLTTYDNIMNSKVKGKPIVIPGDPVNSKICRVLYALDLIPMPPLFNLPLLDRTKQTFVRWVQEGAENTACDARCDTSTYKYIADIAPMMRKYCSGCHYGNYASAGIYTNTYLKVKALVDSNNIFYKCISGNPAFARMPTGNVVMPPCDVITVRKWIESGAPNN